MERLTDNQPDNRPIWCAVCGGAVDTASPYGYGHFHIECGRALGEAVAIIKALRGQGPIDRARVDSFLSKYEGGTR